MAMPATERERGKRWTGRVSAGENGGHGIAPRIAWGRFVPLPLLEERVPGTRGGRHFLAIRIFSCDPVRYPSFRISATSAERYSVSSVTMTFPVTSSDWTS